MHGLSVDMEVGFENQNELQLKIERLDASLKEGVQQQLQELAESIRETAQHLAPTRTGYLCSTIFTEVTAEWTVRVSAKAPYAAYVEFGTRFMHGRHFLSRAVEMHQPRLFDVVDQAVSKSIAEASP